MADKVRVTKLQIAQIASEFTDDSWSRKIPGIGDWVSISDITNGIESWVMRGSIVGVHRAIGKPRIIEVSIKTDRGNDFSLSLHPSQLVSGLYTIGDRCFSIAIIAPPTQEAGDDGESPHRG